MPTLVLDPAMPSPAPPDWSGSIWIGAVDAADDIGGDVELTGATGYSRVRLLVRRGRYPLGFVELPAADGVLDPNDLQAAVRRLPDGPAAVDDGPANPISVVLCTRDRPEFLRSALSSLLAMDYPDFEIVVVDNASATSATGDVVASVNDPRVRLASEPVPGLARARNRGVLAATHDIVAFTDDDVVVDPQWLRGIDAGFAAAPDIACVCGIVPSGELRSYSQAYFDGRVTWARSCTPTIYRLVDPPPGHVLFPFKVGEYGTGANFALRRSALLQVGGFDEALGVGSPTRGGEDVDMFVRMLLDGHALMYQPQALVWHRHRADLDALHEQIVGYGVGLGAWIAKLMTSRRTAPMVLRRSVRALRHVRTMTRVDVDPGAETTAPNSRSLAIAELRAALRGPLAYARARRSGARPTPLRTAAS